MTRRRYWTPAKLARLRDLRSKGLSLCEVARRLRRTMKAVTFAVNHYGLPRQKRARTDGAWQEHLREEIAADLCDACVARALGCDRHTILDWRRRLALRPTPAHQCPRCNDTRRNRLSQMCQEWRARNFAEIKRAVLSERAVAAGWPPDLLPREVEILNLLHERGPMTRREMYAALGLAWPGDSRMAFNARDNSHTAYLLKRGLLVVLGRRPRGGKGNNEWVYALPLWVEKGAV